jgi:hypothetical protein
MERFAMNDKPTRTATLSAIALAVFLAAPARAELVDRIVAVVGGRALAWSAAYEEARYQALRKAEPPPGWSPTETAPDGMNAVLTVLIDQTLLQQALSRSPFAPSGSEDVSDRVTEIEREYPSGEAYRAALQRCGFTEQQLRDRLARERLLMTFVDATLRPRVRLAEDAVASYYRDVLVPEMSAGGASAPPLDNVRLQIEEILTQQQINRLLEEWLEQLRRSARIERL